MNTGQIIAAYNILAAAKLTKMGWAGKGKVIKAVLAMKPVHAAYMDCVQETMTRLKPEWMDGEKEQEWQRNGMGSEVLTSSEKAEIQQYLAQADACLKDQFEREHDIKFPRLTDEEFEEFADSNDYTVGQLLAIHDVLA